MGRFVLEQLKRGGIDLDEFVLEGSKFSTWLEKQSLKKERKSVAPEEAPG
jgi:hypothetical protein